MRNLAKSAFIVFALFSEIVFADSASPAPWHHPNSPCRAVFSLVRPPSHPRAGIALQVPSRGLGEEREGRDFYAFAADGTPLALHVIGSGLRNRTLTLVGVPDRPSDIYLYFGSGGIAPQDRIGFRPSVLIRALAFERGEANRWSQAEALLSEAEVLGGYIGEKISLGHNPVDSRDRFAVDFQGWLAVETSGDYTFALVSENAGFLLVNDRLLIERDSRSVAGSARRGEFNHTVRLARGLHSVRCVVFTSGGPFVAMVGRLREQGRALELVPPEAFLRTGSGQLRRLDWRSSRPHPFFDYTIISYIGYEGEFYHLVELKTLTGAAADWVFDNGTPLRGATVRLVVPGLQSRYLRVRQGSRVLDGKIDFPSPPPPRNSIEDAERFALFVDLMTDLPLARLDTRTLWAYHRFIRYRESHPALAATGELLAERPDLTAEERGRVLLDLARVASPNQAEQAYAEFFKRSPDSERAWHVALMEFYEFLLFRMNSPTRAQAFWQRLQEREPLSARRFELMRLDLALAREDSAGAASLYRQMTGTAAALREQRQAQVQGGNLQRSFHQHLQAGLLESAWEVLRQWDEVSPEHRHAGDFQLARGQLFLAYGWREAALRNFEQALRLNPQMARAPEIKLAMWRVLHDLERDDEAGRLRRELRDEYPGHPAVGELPQSD